MIRLNGIATITFSKSNYKNKPIHLSDSCLIVAQNRPAADNLYSWTGFSISYRSHFLEQPLMHKDHQH